jgi:hypothetical protein
MYSLFSERLVDIKITKFYVEKIVQLRPRNFVSYFTVNSTTVSDTRYKFKATFINIMYAYLQPFRRNLNFLNKIFFL